MGQLHKALCPLPSASLLSFLTFDEQWEGEQPMLDDHISKSASPGFKSYLDDLEEIT